MKKLFEKYNMQKQQKKFDEIRKRMEYLESTTINQRRLYQYESLKTFFNLPRSPKFSEFLKLKTVSILRNNLNKYKRLNFADPRANGSLFKIVHRHEKYVSLAQGAEQVGLRSLGSFLVMPLYLIAPVLPPFFTPALMGIKIAFGMQLAWLLPSAIISILLFTATLQASYFWVRKNLYLPGIGSILFILLLEWLLLLQIMRIPNPQLVYILSTPLVSQGSIFFLYLLLILFTLLFLDFSRKRSRSKRPISYLLHEYLQALSVFDKANDGGFDIQERKNVSNHLIESARIISSHLSKTLKSRDATLNSMSNQTIARILAGSRSLALSVMVSRESEIKDIREKIEKNFIATATENLGDLFMTEPEKIPVQYTFDSLANAIRAVVVGVLPLTGVWLGMKTGLLTEGARLDSLILLSTGWLIWQLVTLIDPEINKRIASFKEVLNLFIGFTKP